MLTVAVALAACSDDGEDGGGQATASTSAPTSIVITAPTTTTTTAIPGLQTFATPSRRHVLGPVSYAEVPPVGGDHHPVWQNCGFYSRPVEPERAVHSLEHGAIWVTYSPDLPAEQVDILRQLARSRTHVLVSPWPDGSLLAPVVASGWAVQLKASSVSDPALAAFVAAYAGRGQAPEPGASCSGAFGVPE